MNIATPATIANEIERELAALVLQAKRWFSDSDPALVDISDRLEKLAKVDAAKASVYRGTVAHMQGKVEEMEKWFRNAEWNQAPFAFVNNARCAALANLGFFEAAADLYRKGAVIDNPLLRLLIGQGVTVASFDTLAKVGAQAMSFGLAIEPLLVERAAAASATLNRLGVSEPQVRAILDQCGEMLRARGLFWAGVAPDLTVSEDPDEPGLLLELRVDCPVDQVIDMNDELVDRCVDADLVRPGISIAFVRDGDA